MDKKLIAKLKATFDSILHVTEEGVEFWLARELQEVLGYTEWRNFSLVIDKARTACQNSHIEELQHFVDVNKSSPMPNGGVRIIEDIMLTRYACYLVAQNGDPRKEEIAFAQSYFALKTRQQEVLEARMELLARMENRGRLRESEKRLSQNIYERGVDDQGFARIRSKGDQALFGGDTTATMKIRLGIPASRPLADFLPTITIAAKNLAAEMTNYNVEVNDLQGEEPITTEHVQNNASVRQMLGKRGIRPEELPPAEDIKKLERRVKAEEKKLPTETDKFNDK